MHDYAKNMPLKEMQRIAKKHGLTSDKKTLRSGALLHGLVGAHLCKQKFGIRDEEILSAIRYHTVGRPNMTDVELCIFVADVIEPKRRPVKSQLVCKFPR
jgi:predicted HD superfamily hydrolase involved in NAD metabolism